MRWRSVRSYWPRSRSWPPCSLNKQDHALETSLLSLGDSECRFAVLETDDPLDGYSDALETRFVDETEGKG
ncbi:hypothetical protein [Streptomyces chartreusis]|uniref:hypothetical protein n=1 Tax=Streptomyces chartreusis TaxID=1969 RepID=UPI0034076B25